MVNPEDAKTLQEEVDEFLKELDLKELGKSLKEDLQGDSSPIFKLVELILNEASLLHATEVIINADGKKCYVSHLISGEWVEAEAPPKYLFPNIRNLYMTFAGIEYWKQGKLKGTINQANFLQEWDFEISEDHNQLHFQTKTNS